MRELEDCYKYQGNIRATSSNSFVASGRVMYIAKKDYEDKPLKVYNVYDVETKVQVASHWNKEFLARYVANQDLSIFGSSGSLF